RRRRLARLLPQPETTPVLATRATRIADVGTPFAEIREPPGPIAVITCSVGDATGVPPDWAGHRLGRRKCLAENKLHRCATGIGVPRQWHTGSALTAQGLTAPPVCRAAHR